MKQKIYKLCSIMLTLAMVLSMCVCAIGTVSAAEATYYVSPTGDDANDGLSVSTPKATVDAVITAANSLYGEGDTVNIKLIKGETANAVTADSNAVSAHAFTLKISSEGEKAALGTATGFTLGGDTVFENVLLNVGPTTGSGYPSFNMDGKSMTLNAGTSFNNSQWDLVLTGSYNRTYSNDINIAYNTTFSKAFRFGVWGQPIINGDLNFTIDNGDANEITLGASQRKESQVNGTVNIDIKSASSFKANVGTNIYGENAKIQIVNSAGVDITATVDKIKEIGIPYYVINNKTGNKNGIERTDVEGKYKINIDTEKYTLSIDGEPAVIEEGFVTVEPGVYDFTVTKEPETFTYYVSNTGSDDNVGSKESPLKSVVAAIGKGNDNFLIEGDKVNVIVMDDVNWLSDTITATPNHVYKVNINAANPSNKPTITVSTSISFGGDTELDNVKFTGFGQYNVSYLMNHDITFGPGVDFKPYELALGSWNTGDTVAGQNIVINSAMSLPSVFYLCNAGNNYKVYSEDINITVNNPGASIAFSPTQYYGNGVTYKKNVNFNILNAAKISVREKYTQKPTVTAEGAFQFIIDKPQNTTLTEAAIDYIEGFSPDNGYYVVYNNSGIDGLISFTEYAGEFAVDTEAYVVKAVDENGNEAVAEDGVLALPDWGEFSVTATEKEATYKTYYVESGAVGGDGQEATPYGSVAEAVEAAKAAGLTKIDSLTVKLLGNADLGTLPEYKFALTVESATEKAALTIGTNAIANGKTVYKNITLDGQVLDFGGNAVTLESDVDFVGLTIDVTDAKAVIDAKLALVDITAENNIDLVVNNSESEATIKFSQNTYGNVKIDIKAADAIAFQGALNATGTVELIANNSAEVTGISYDAIAANGGKWYISDQSGENGGISFTETAGNFGYVSGKEVELIGDETYVPVNRVITAPAGEYVFKLKTQETAKHQDHIVSRGQNLKNVYAKLARGEEINVVYMGGSVTVGSGSTTGYSWREQIGEWLKNTFPNNKINNITAAYGGTGTHFGMFRLDEDVLQKEPDLLFIEFSINDFYDHLSEKQASINFETIIRQVREQYPECDIITLYTTEKSKIADLINSDTLHSQAKAHDEIAKAYNIPAIRLGHALADHLHANANGGSATADPLWSEYMTDIVHPSNKGYAVYYETVKEYVAGQLVYGDYDGTVTAHTIPDTVNEVLLDGYTGFIDGDNDLANKSFDLGGTGFSYNASAGSYRGNFAGGIVSSSGNNSKFVLKFTGTELTLFHGGSNFTGFKVTVDGGVAKTVTKDVGPTVIAKDLAYGEHTVEISPISTEGQTASLNIYGFFTRDARKATHEHNYGSYENDANATCTQNATETAVCSVCGNNDTREILNSKADHTYDGCEDTDCNVCGEVREAGHTYDGVCDADCNVCGETRTVEDHVYDNNCDADCNVCGATRTPADHVYDNAGDTTCNVCGDVREVADGFVKEGGVYYYYEDGVKSTETTLVKVNGSWFYLENGAWTKKTALVKYSGSYFYVIKGKWTTKTNDLIKYNGSWFYVKNGKWNKTTDLIKKDGVYFFVKNGKWSTAITTLFKKSGKFFSIKGGKWSKTTQIITYSGKKFYCKSGFAQLGFTGKAKVGSKTYNIVKGQVK